MATTPSCLGLSPSANMPSSYMFGTKSQPRFLTITDAFLHHASTRPYSIAARDLSSPTGRPLQITYGDLSQRSSRLARKLRQLGVTPGDRVPLVVKRGIDMLVGILAILTCGAQYVPLDAGVVPESTLRFITQQAGGPSCTVLTLKSGRHRLDACNVANVVCIDEPEDLQDDGLHGQGSPLESLAKPNSGCYVIYTSGTTGTPKGVDVTHRNVCNLVCSAPGNLGITHGTRVGQVLSISFDMAAWEILGCLCNGGTLVLRGSDWRQALKKIDVLISTPSILSKYDPKEFPNIKTAANAGEPSSQRLADAWATSGTYYNCCGPTETTIVNTMHRHVPGQPLTIGKPTPNNNVYILDESMKPVFPGEPGVMWAGGWGVSRGYVNLDEKTAEKYRPDPFANDGSMMYDTGDLGRWTADGSIDILGRQDDQVKVKGFRIELDGITSSLRSCPTVDEATVILIDGHIHAFFTPSSCDLDQVRKHMKFCQPYYAVPEHFHALDDLPLTANGKIDKKALKARTTIKGDAKVAQTSEVLEKPVDIPMTLRHAASSSTIVDDARSVESYDSLEKPKQAVLSLREASSSSTLGEDARSLETCDSLEKPKHAMVTVGKSSASTYSDSCSESGRSESGPGSDASSASSFTVADEKANIDLEAAVPDKLQGKHTRGLRYRILIVYRRLFSFMGIVNIAAAIAIILNGFPREWLGTLTAINLLITVLIRQEFVINALYTITCSVPKSWPIFIRKRCARIFHLGGVHSGAGVSAALWLLANNLGDAACMTTGQCSGSWGTQSIAAQVVSWVLTGLFVVMLVMAYPAIRKTHHNLFERTHRFVGWTMLALFWVQVMLSINDNRGEGVSMGAACLRSPPMWLLAVATLSIASSWFWLRRVPVEAEVLSDHAVRLHFDYTVPVNGSFTRLSRKPLTEWHSFATIPAPEPENGRRPGYSLVVSNAGDWTKKCIQDAPSHLWVRGVPTCGVMRIATLFNRIVVIATGSGIGPLLGHLQDPSCPTQLIWSTSRPEKTFGEDMVNTIRHKIPGAVIHDTKLLGRPDLVKMGYNLAKGFEAEAVIIIANEKITRKVVYGLETRGIPAYGAIWDS